MVIAILISRSETATTTVKIFKNSMEAFFHLPAELQTLVLKYLEEEDLDRLFELPALLRQGAFCSPYLALRHQALWAKFYRKNLVMLNSEEFRRFSLQELEYLMEQDIVIAPSEITVVLFDFTDYKNSLSFMYTMFKQYFPHLRRLTRNFSVQLLLVENVPLENTLLKQLFEPLCSGEYNVNWFTIKYHPGMGKRTRANGPLHFDVNELLQSGNEIAITNLQLHLFNSNNLLKHLVDDSGCFYCRNLKSLDLSFNNITDTILESLRLPGSLEHLNLSNNLLKIINNRTLPYRHLTELRTLNLSNNNIMKVELLNYALFEGQMYNLQLVNLAGNLIADYRNLCECTFFERVKRIDLSKNLLERITPFPQLVLSIDLSANYFALHGHQMVGVFPRGLRRLCVSAAMPTDQCYCEFARYLIQEAELWSLGELQICGVNRELPTEVM